LYGLTLLESHHPDGTISAPCIVERRSFMDGKACINVRSIAALAAATSAAVFWLTAYAVTTEGVAGDDAAGLGAGRELAPPD
jgi:hypothetical protein